jgi:hypothetical protein
MRNIFIARFCLFLCLLLLTVSMSYSQISVTSPGSRDDVRAASDYADEVLMDRWDMNERSDLGWRTFNTVELPPSCLTNISFAGGHFSATSNGNDPNITLLDSAYPGSAMLGKVGTNFPINADKYTRLVFRMYLDITQTTNSGQLFWSKNTIYPGAGGGTTRSQNIPVHPGWAIYCVDIPATGIGSGTDPWNGWIDSLRWDPIVESGRQIKLDWVRLVEYSAGCTRQISWSGNSGNVDIYLDTNTNPGDGRVGLLAKNVSGSSYTLLAGGLAPGNYYVAIVPTGGDPASAAYSTGYYHVNSAPIIRLTNPSAKGSNTDFISISTGNPWDMANSNDIDYTVNLKSGASFTTLSYQDLAGSSFSNRSVFLAENVNGNRDPEVFFLHFIYRGNNNHIDTSKYHNLTFKMGIEGVGSVNDGSVARVLWKNKDEAGENVSQDIIIRHKAGGWIMNEVTCDMNSLPLDNGPSQSGWNGFLDSFRIDPHEFLNSRRFFFDDIRLTTDCEAQDSFNIEWNLSDSDHNPSVSLYFDNNNTGYNGTPIVSGLTPGTGSGNYVWDTSGVPEGTYWLYAVVDDGINSHRSYATGPLKVTKATVPGPSPEISLSQNSFYFGAERFGPATEDESILITNTGEGTLSWSAVPDRSWITVTPGSGTGGGFFKVGVNHAGLGVGTRTGTVRIEDPNATNSPQFINISLTVYQTGWDHPPFGVFDTPPEGAVVSGNIPVSGWALDDIEIDNVILKRSSHPNDPPGAVGPDGLVYIDKALFIKGARPDVQAAYPNYPHSNKAGWGCMVLTNFLPDQGNGAFTIFIFATDVTGHTVKLGQKIIYCDNANRVKPFGTIDTPTRGGIISGTDFINFGWALTPQPKTIPFDGSTIHVFVDGVPLGNPTYNQYRPDLATLFPGYNNSNGAAGYFRFDTTQFANGVHNIAWSVRDDQGSIDGIGARYIEIQNLGGGTAAVMGVAKKAGIEDISGTLKIKAILETPDSHKVLGSRALRDNARPKVSLDSSGGKILRIEIEEIERIVLGFEITAGNGILGWGQNEDQELPIGSSLDHLNKKFYWIPGPGFLGTHVLHFAASDGTFRSLPVTVIVNIVPKEYRSKLPRITH